MQSSGDSARLPEEARGVRQSVIVVAVKELLSVLFVMFSAAQSRERRWRASRGFFFVQPFAFDPRLTTEKAVSILHEPWTSVSFVKDRCR